MALAMELERVLTPVYPPSCSSTCTPTSRASRSLAMAALAQDNNNSHNNSMSPPSSSSAAEIPKMEPFDRSRVSRLTKEPSLLQKAEHAISDRCSILQGDAAYECWEALFEFENMKEEYTGQCNVAIEPERQTACRPLERLENFVRQSGGVASLINNVRVLAKANEMRKALDATAKQGMQQTTSENTPHVENEKGENPHPFLEPGDLPPTEEEVEFEKSGLMPESAFTRVLRAVGIPAPWFGQPPR